jgi:hypothetical protein
LQGLRLVVMNETDATAALDGFLLRCADFGVDQTVCFLVRMAGVRYGLNAPDRPGSTLKEALPHTGFAHAAGETLV